MSKKLLAGTGKVWKCPPSCAGVIFPLSTATPITPMAYAIFKTGGKQYRVSEGERIDVERLDLEVGQEATFDQVLAVSGGEGLKVGNPTVDGASIVAEVVDQVRAKKVIAFRFKRRKGYHKTRGHRRQLTRLAIKSITA